MLNQSCVGWGVVLESGRGLGATQILLLQWHKLSQCMFPALLTG